VLSIPLVATTKSNGWHCIQFTTVATRGKQIYRKPNKRRLIKPENLKESRVYQIHHHLEFL